MRISVWNGAGVALAALLAACGPSDAADKAVQDTPPLSASKAVSAAEEEDAMQGTQVALAFPAAFRGAWDYDVDGCQRQESGTRFTIGETTIIGYESTQTLQSIRQLAADEIRVTVYLETAHGDDTYDMVMALSPVDGVSMRIDLERESVRAYRCDTV